MITLAFDTETTGKYNFKESQESPNQPRLVQLGALLVIGDSSPMMHLNAVIKPDGWEIPKEAAQIHGITTELAMMVGLPIDLVLYLFNSAVQLAEEIVVFNRQFDESVMATTYARTGIPNLLLNSKVKWVDVMMESKDHCKLPGQYGDYKWPKLSEAYRHFFGEDPKGAHGALWDAANTLKIWRKIQALPKNETRAETT